MESLTEKVFYIVDVMNKHDYTPHLSGDLDAIYDTSFPDCQPFLFKASYKPITPLIVVGVFSKINTVFSVD